MSRGHQKVAAALSAIIFAAAVVAGVPHRWVEAASTSSTVTEGVEIGGSVSNSIINNPITKQDPAVLAAMAKTFADQMAVTTEARAKSEAKAAELATQLDFTKAAVAEFFKIVGEQNISEEKIPTRLVEIATHFAQIRDTLPALLESDDPRVVVLARAAKQGLNNGRLTEVDRQLRRAAETVAMLGEICLLELRYADAAERFEKAAQLAPAGEPALLANYLSRQADALARLGDKQDDNAALNQSIETWRLVLQYRPRALMPLDWAMTQNNLGDVLRTLGERESGTAHLIEAVVAYNAALDESAFIQNPLDRAMIWMNLGNVLRALGERENGTAQLQEAIAAYDRALVDLVLSPEIAQIAQANRDESTAL